MTEYPFFVADQAILFRERPTRPWIAYMEVHTGTTLDEGRLGAAVTAACLRHPMAHARAASDPRSTPAPAWVVPDELDVDPFRGVRPLPDDEALRRVRVEGVTTPIPLDTSPPARVLLGRRPDGDVVVITHSHVPMDGLSMVRFVSSIARAYRGDDDPPDPVPFDEARHPSSPVVGGGTAPAGAAATAAPARSRAAIARGLLDEMRRPAAALAADGEAKATEPNVLTRVLDAERTAAVNAGRPEGTTLNDVLVGALHLAVDRWNRAHGRTPDRIKVAIPVSTRPPRWRGQVAGNYISSITITTEADERADLAGAAGAASAQTEGWRASVQAGQVAPAHLVGGGLPLPLKRALPRVLGAVLGQRVRPSAGLSNLGRLPSDFRFGDDPPVAVHAAAPSPVGIGVIAIVVGGRLALTMHHERSHLSPAAAERFADEYVSLLPG